MEKNISSLLSPKIYQLLSQRVHAFLAGQSWMERHGFELLKLFSRVVLFGISFWLFSFNGIWFKIIGIVFLSYFYYGITITAAHELRHSSFFSISWLNRSLAYIISDFWASQSNVWWHTSHVVLHHPYTNMPNKEPQQFYYSWINKYVYFFVLPFLVVFWLMYNSVVLLWKKNKFELGLYLFFMTAGWFFQIKLFMLIFPFWLALLSVIIMRSLFAPIFMHLGIFNHVGLDVFYEKKPWLEHQIRTTRNVKKNWFLNGLGGNAFVDCHIEHHLFPTISNHLLPKIKPFVVKALSKENIFYKEESYVNILNHCLENYHSYFYDINWVKEI